MLLFAEGWDLYGNASDLAANGWFAPINGLQGNPNTNITRSRASFRTWGTVTYRNYVAGSSTLIFGMAINFQSLPNNGNGYIEIIRFVNASGSSFNIGLNISGYLIVGWDTSAMGWAVGINNPLWTSTTVEPTGSWNYYEFKVTFNNVASGSFTIKRNNVTMVSQTNVKTCGTSALPNILVFPSYVGYLPDVYIDDLYICDSTGSRNNDFLGDISVVAQLPAVDSAVNFIRNTGATNVSAVNQTVQDGDTTYVSAASPMTDAYTLAALPANTSQVFAVIPTMIARKNDTGACTARNRIVSSGTVAVGATVAPGISYQNVSDIFETNPAGSITWTPTAVNNLLIGPERVS